MKVGFSAEQLIESCAWRSQDVEDSTSFPNIFEQENLLNIKKWQ